MRRVSILESGTIRFIKWHAKHFVSDVASNTCLPEL